MKVKYISYLVIVFLSIQLNAMQDDLFKNNNYNWSDLDDPSFSSFVAGLGDHRGNDSSRRNNLNQWGIWIHDGGLADCRALQAQRHKKYLSKVEKVIKENTVNSKPYLAKACFHGWNDIAKLLIENGANLEQPKSFITSLKTPLECAFGETKEKIQLVDLLLSCGAKIKKGMLSHACARGYVDVVKLLLEKGAGNFVNEIEDSGSTPLTLAILHVDWNHVKQYQLVKLLISYGADTSIVITEGKWKGYNSYEIATNKGIVDLLDNFNKSPKS